MIKVCVVCGKEFETQTQAKTCSDECRKARAYDRVLLYRAIDPERYREYNRRHRKKEESTRETQS